MQARWFLLFSWLLAGMAAAAALEDFVPQGETLEASQARAHFATPMVTAGRHDAPAPFKVDCAVGGHGWWADERTWVFDLAGLPQAGESCRFQPLAGLRDRAGAPVAVAGEYAFNIAGPRVAWSLPAAGATVDEDQAFVLLLNGAAQSQSVQALARCEIQGIHEQVDVRRLTGAERARLLGDLRERL